MTPLRVGDRHDLGDPADVDLQRVDAQIRQSAAGGQPLGQPFGIEDLVACARSQVGARQAHDRMLRALGAGEAALRTLRIVGRDHAVFQQPVDQQLPVEPTGRAGGLGEAQRSARNRRLVRYLQIVVDRIADERTGNRVGRWRQKMGSYRFQLHPGRQFMRKVAAACAACAAT
jgi:hypothetical protein